jgi:hypothetical protein
LDVGKDDDEDAPNEVSPPEAIDDELYPELKSTTDDWEEVILPVPEGPTDDE